MSKYGVISGPYFTHYSVRTRNNSVFGHFSGSEANKNPVNIYHFKLNKRNIRKGIKLSKVNDVFIVNFEWISYLLSVSIVEQISVCWRFQTLYKCFRKGNDGINNPGGVPHSKLLRGQIIDSTVHRLSRNDIFMVKTSLSPWFANLTRYLSSACKNN